MAKGQIFRERTSDDAGELFFLRDVADAKYQAAKAEGSRDTARRRLNTVRSLGQRIEDHEQQVYQALVDTTPQVVRRTPLQRTDSLTEKVLTDAMAFFRLNGRWPKSAIDTLRTIAERDHDPSLTTDGGVEQFIRQGKALARYLAETGERKQAEQDSKRVVRNWAGH
jgi:hypothetical protein